MRPKSRVTGQGLDDATLVAAIDEARYEARRRPMKVCIVGASGELGSLSSGACIASIIHTARRAGADFPRGPRGAEMNDAAAAVQARSDEVARRAVQLMLEAAPSYAATLDERGRRLCEEDAGLHVRALVGSVVAGDPKIFGDYAVWAAELLSRFGIAAEHLAALFSATGDAIAELAPAAAAAVKPHLEAGEHALAR